MSKKNDIPKASNGKAPEFDLDGARVPYGDKEASDFVPEKSFWKHSPLGRTLTLRNKTGKTIAGLITGGIGVATGVDVSAIINPIIGVPPMEQLFELFGQLNIESILMLVGGLIVMAIASFATSKKWFTAQMKKEFLDIWGEFKRARLPESEGGKKVTDSEKPSYSISLWIS